MNNNHFNPPTINLPRQEGAVLIVALILLVVMTMLGISGMEATKLETRMAANVQDYNSAFQRAEAGLAWTSAACIQAGVGTLSHLDGNFVSVPCDTPPESLKNVRTQIRGGIQGKANASMNEVPYMVSSIGRSGDSNDPDTINVTLLGGIIMRTGARDMTVLKQVGNSQQQQSEKCSLRESQKSTCTTQSSTSTIEENCAGDIRELIDDLIREGVISNEPDDKQNCTRSLVDEACNLTLENPPPEKLNCGIIEVKLEDLLPPPPPPLSP